MSPLQTGITGDAPAIINKRCSVLALSSRAMQRQFASGRYPYYCTAFDTISSSHSASIQARRPAASIVRLLQKVAQRALVHIRLAAFLSLCDAAPAARRQAAMPHCGSARHKVGADLPPSVRLPRQCYALGVTGTPPRRVPVVIKKHGPARGNG